jgi:LacI family transcriptional regulator
VSARKRELATSEDVARLASVSRATVSNFLSGSKYVSPELAERVQAAIRQLNYRPHGIARSLAARKTYSIGLLVPRISSSFYPPIVSAVESTVGKAGYSIILGESCESAATEETMLRVLAEKRVDGIVWVPCSTRNLPFAHSLSASGFPVVIVDRRLDTNELDMVVSDNEGAGKSGTRYLLSLGYRRILIFSFSQSHAPARERLRGYHGALREAGIEEEDSLVCIVGTPDYGDASEKLASILRGTHRPEAIFACSDVLTFVAMQECRRAELSLPEDIAILGFDDSPWGAFVDPPLTVMTQDTRNLGALAAKILLERLEKRREGNPQLVELPVTLVKRTSCGEGRDDLGTGDRRIRPPLSRLG